MNRNETLLLSAWFVAVVVVCLLRDPVSASLGAVAGAAASTTLLPRVLRVRRAVSRRLGEDVVVRTAAVRPRVLGVRVGLHLVAIAALAVLLVFVPFAAGRVLSALVAGLTVLLLVLTVAGRRLTLRQG